MNWRPAITEIGISPRWPCIQKAVVANVRIMKPKRQPHDEGYIVSEPEMSVSFILCGISAMNIMAVWTDIIMSNGACLG